MDKMERGWAVRKWVTLPELTQVGGPQLHDQRVNTEDEGQEGGGQQQSSPEDVPCLVRTQILAPLNI